MDCAHCQFSGGDGCGGFDVDVPIADERGDDTGTATLHCVVSKGKHGVTLTRWVDHEGRVIDPEQAVQTRLATALGYVAEKRLCGNRKLCPSEVVSIAVEFDRS